MSNFGPNTCKPMIADPIYNHRAVVPPDDGGVISFRWHFQRGMLQPRMSGYELAMFVIKHMPAILPLLGGHPRVQAEFAAMLNLIATIPSVWSEEEGIVIDESNAPVIGPIDGHQPGGYLTSNTPGVRRVFQHWAIKKTVDKLLPWIRSVTRTEQDDIIHMSLFDKTEQAAGPVYFVLGGK